MQVIKRDGTKESVKLEKISKRVSRAAKDCKNVDPVLIAQKVVQGLYDNVSTKELDQLAIETAYSLSVKHPEYDKIALRLAVSALHKETDSKFSNVVGELYQNKDLNGGHKQLLSDAFNKFVKKHAAVLDTAIDYSRDYLFDYFGFKTLERSYLLKISSHENGQLVRRIVERPQHMWMRVAVGIHLDDIDAAIATYEMLSTLRATHATPTLFNAGAVKNQQSSCFLIAMKEDSIPGIFDTLKEVALISQSAGGIGVHIHNIRSKGSPIHGTNGVSNGLVPMLKVYNETGRYVDQGGGKRKGSIAIYLAPHHADIFEFLDLRKNDGKEELRARDLNLALWVPDLFFKRVEADEMWSLMDPNVSKGLEDVYGQEFETLYTKYEQEGRFVRQLKARDLWAKIVESQIETGQPYLCAKDAGNAKSNQSNIGVIKSSNLCAEIFEYSDADETAVCNLASISLPACLDVRGGKKSFNHTKLADVTRILTENLNKVIDTSYYPVKEAKNSNKQHRPIGIGIQGLADVFAQLKMPWDSTEALALNAEIAETIYYSAMNTSCKMAEKIGENGSYSSFKGSPLSQGKFQFDLWGVTPSNRYDWNELRERVQKFGVRNSLLTALMPTASTAQVMGNTECFEPITSNVYKRSTLSGEFIQVNRYLVEDLIALGLWSEDMRQKIISLSGSIQAIAEIPADIKALYKTVWELSQRILIDMAAARGPFICQSQSLNLYFKDPNSAKLTSAYFYAWKKGLKTLVYYTRTQASREATKFTVDRSIEDSLKGPAQPEAQIEEAIEDGVACSLDNPDDCLMCGS